MSKRSNDYRGTTSSLNSGRIKRRRLSSIYAVGLEQPLPESVKVVLEVMMRDESPASATAGDNDNRNEVDG